MASYEYLDIEEYRDYIVSKAKTKLLYRSNINNTEELTSLLNDLFDDAHRTIVNWRKLNTEDEFLSQKWDAEIINYIVDAYRAMGDELLASDTANGIIRAYRISPLAKLKSSIPQKM